MFFRLMCLFVAVAVIGVGAGISPVSQQQLQHQQQQIRNIIVVKDVSEFARSHPGVNLKLMTKQTGKARDSSVYYTLGGRVSGDRLVAQGADVFAYPAKKNIAIQITYPEVGTGSIVTYIEIVCQQDNFEGNAYVLAGGIGQRFVSIVLEAADTETFAYTAQYYGV